MIIGCKSAMHWKTKAAVLRIAAALPGGAALDRLRKRRLIASTRTAIDLHLTPALKMLARLRGGYGWDPDGACVLEIGAGWNPVYGVLFSILGARRVLLFDVERYLTASAVDEVAAGLSSRLDRIAGATGRDPALLARRLSEARGARGLAGRLQALRIDYRAPGDAAKTGLPAGSVDLVWSTCVLEHIPAADLPAIHRETARVLSPRGLAYHIVDLSDHFAHGDPGLHRLNFLTVGADRWRRIGQHRLMYLNRLRAPQVLSGMRDAGLTIREVEAQSDANDLAFVKGAALAEEFRAIPPEDAAVHLMHVVAGSA